MKFALLQLDATDGLLAALCHFYQSENGDAKLNIKTGKTLPKKYFTHKKDDKFSIFVN